MVEIRTFEGDVREMSDFTTDMWRRSYRGKMPMPLWTPEFLEWELLPKGEEARDFLVAAYDGAKLVGFLPARPVKYQIHGETVRGTMGSYLSVDPDYRRQGIALKMHREQQRRHSQRGAAINMGYVYLGSKVAGGQKFWLNQPDGSVIVSKVGLRARLLNPRAVARFEYSARDAWGARLLGLLQRTPSTSPDQSGIRDFRQEDLPRCLELVKQLTDMSDFGYAWDADSLSRQLAFKNLPRSLVLENDGEVAGLASYCPLEFWGRDTMRAGVIDLLAFGRLSHKDRKRLVRAVLARMMAEELDVALVLRISCNPARPLRATGFVPMPADYYYIGLVMEPGFQLQAASRLHIHWR